MTATLASLPTTRREILTTLKECGAARAEELASALGITVSAIRQHLAALDAGGLVSHREIKGGPGRPKFVFHLTPAAEGLFPQAYGELANDLLDIIQTEDPHLASRVLSRLAERNLGIDQNKFHGQAYPERLRNVMGVLDERGFLSKLETHEDGSFVITLHNCTVLSVAQNFPLFCAGHIAALQNVLPEIQFTQVSRMREGSHACQFQGVLRR
jgi:DeoR family suf operon transcriptional repressor